MNKVFENLMHLTQCSSSKTSLELLHSNFTLVNSVKRTIVNILPSISINLKKVIFIGFVFITNTINAQVPTFGNTSTINICVNGTYYLNPSTTNGTFSSGNAAIATVNSSGYVTGVSVGTTTVQLVTTGGTVTATVTVGASSSLAITDPLAQASYKFSNNPQGPVGGINNYVGYNGYTYSSQARPINTGFFRTSNQSGNASGCPYEYFIFRCTTCGTVPEYATRPQGTITGNTIQSGVGSLTYTSTNGGGPYFTVVYVPSGGSNVSIPNIISGTPFSIGTSTSTTSYNLISVTDQSTNASTDFSGITTSISVVPPPTASLTGAQTICAGVTANLSLTTTGTGSITVTLSNGLVVSTISGTTSISVTPTTSSTYSISSVSDISGSGTISGTSATVSVNPLTAISVQPLSTVTLVQGATVTLSVTATNATAYKWYKGGVEIPSSNASTYTTANTTAGAGTYYVTVSGTCNTVTSVNSIVNVFPIPQGTLSGSVVNQGETGRLTYTSSNSPVGGPFTIVYLPSGGTNVTVTNVTSGVAFNVASGTPSATTTYSLVSITQETSTISRTSFTSTPTATINIINTPTVASTITSTITSSTAILGGVLSSTGGATTTIGIMYSTASNFGTSTSTIINSNAVAGTSTTTISGLSAVTTYYAKAYATNTAGTTYGPTISFTTPVAPIVAGSSYQDGIVFYIFQPSDIGYYVEGETHGLIAAPVDQSSGMSWNQGSNLITGATGTAIGTGKSNTDKIISFHPTNSAAAVARAYRGGGYSDWYLPSIDEILLMYKNIGIGIPARLPSDPKYNIGGFPTSHPSLYFSSSESSENPFDQVWYIFMENGTYYQGGDYSRKTQSWRVRAIRKF